MLEVDARELSCPMPLLKAKLALNSLAPGERVRVLATDSSSQRDFTVFASKCGHHLLESSESGGVYCYVLQKADASQVLRMQD